jgi:VWFA-related protein
VGTSGDLTHDPLPFRSDSNVVLVPATVLDRYGAAVNGLSRDAFDLTADRVTQPIAFFGEEDVPASIGIILDQSGSMRRVLGSAKDLLRGFFNASNPEDEACLFTVSTRPAQISGFTHNFDDLQARMIFTATGGSTALADTIYSALVQMRAATLPRHALLIVSDGMDNHSRRSEAEIIAASVEANLQIYSVSIFDPARAAKPIQLVEEQRGIQFLGEMARRTGGLQIVAGNYQDLKRGLEEMGRAIRSQYVLGFVPEQSGKNRSHRIGLRVRQPNVQVFSRTEFRSED